MSKSLRELQDEMFVWSQRNFPNAQGVEPLLGLAEEVGELAHAHLKGIQKIRHTPIEIHHMKKDAVGDVFIYLADYCSRNNLDLEDCVMLTWDKVSKRDWVKKPMTAGDEAKTEFRPIIQHPVQLKLFNSEEGLPI
jgi:NTP pyrophosphatase (non-canonical NTP hydrolase)